MRNNSKTVSFKEVQNFIENNLKVGELYKVVSRKYKNYLYTPCLIDLSKNKLIYIEKNDINAVVFCLDEKLVRQSWSSGGAASVTPVEETQKQWNLWGNMYIKVLYQGQICLVHAGWLEKI